MILPEDIFVYKWNSLSLTNYLRILFNYLPLRSLTPLIFFLGAILGLSLSVQAGTRVNFPFGGHLFQYSPGSIKPNYLTPLQLDQSVKNFYNLWKSSYLFQGCGKGRYYVWPGDTPGGDKDPNSISISEGHAYGMMITALMAGYDPNAKVYFDGLFHFYKDHPADSSTYLMAWNQVKGCKNSKLSDGSASATDGDLDIAYSLILADRQWGSAGSINYLQESKGMIRAIGKIELNQKTLTTFLGDGKFTLDSSPEFYFSSRSSDFMPDHFRAFRKVTGDSIWSGVVDKIYSIFSSIRTNFSPETGLLPDFIVNTNFKNPSPATPDFLESKYDGEYNYNACRVPLRIGIDYLVSSEPHALEALRKINSWIKLKANSKPENIVDGYKLDGSISQGATGTALAFLTPFAVSATIDSSNQIWLNGLWREMMATPFELSDYYGNTIKLLSMIVVSQNWWNP